MLKTDGIRLACMVFLTLCGLLISTSGGWAQINASLQISPPRTDEFPTISFNVSISDSEGRRVDNLPASSFQIVEDGTAVSPNSVEEIQVGTRQLFVINTNPSMGLRDSSGRTRLFFVQQALIDWWTQFEAAQFASDDLTLVTGQGPLVEHSSASATLASSFKQFQTEFDPAQADFELLLDSLSYLDDDSSQSSMPSFAVFFTTVISQDQELSLTNVIARSQELGVTVFPVLVNPPEDVEEEDITPLSQLAQSTGGRLLTLDPTSLDLSDLRQQILAQRTQYHLSYQSNISQSGAHQVQIRVTGTGLIAESEPRSFQVRVLPPETTFIQPPMQIERSSDDPSVPVELLPPTEHPLEILITFPDDHPRQIESSTLLVNGQQVSQRSQPPFDQFAWDLSSYAQDELVELQVTVTDSLGLEGSTGVHNVQLLVEPPPGGLAALRPALIPLLLIIGLFVLAVVGAVVVMNVGRRSQRTVEPQRDPRQAIQPLSRARLQTPNNQQAEAFLVPLLPGDREGDPIPLVGVDITLGADASLAAYPLRDPSVSGLHARLIRQAGGDYLLRDQGSIAGTWVNYQVVAEQGQRLKHGDQIHLGRIALRFVLAEPPIKPETRIELLGQSPAEEQQQNEEGS